MIFTIDNLILFVINPVGFCVSLVLMVFFEYLIAKNLMKKTAAMTTATVNTTHDA